MFETRVVRWPRLSFFVPILVVLVALMFFQGILMSAVTLLPLIFTLSSLKPGQYELRPADIYDQ